MSMQNETVEKPLRGSRGGWLLPPVLGKMGRLSGRRGLPGEQLEIVGRSGHGELFSGSGKTAQLERS
jgi:hypothetical protein